MFDHARVVIGVGRADADAHQLVFEREAVGQRMQRFGQLGHIGRIVGEKREFLGRYDRIGIEVAVLVHQPEGRVDAADVDSYCKFFHRCRMLVCGAGRRLFASKVTKISLNSKLFP